MQLNKYETVTPQILVHHFLDLCNLVISNFGRWFKTTFSVCFKKRSFFKPVLTGSRSIIVTHMLKVNIERII